MPLEEGREYFSNGSFFTILKRGFELSRKAFIPSYLSKLSAMLLSLLLNFLAIKLIEFILREIKIDPALLPFIIIGIILITAFIIFFVNYIAEGVLYHSSALATIGKNGDITSVKYSLGKTKIWLLFALINLIIEVAIAFITNLFGNIGNIPLMIAVWVIRILNVVISPLFCLIIPFMVLEKRGFLSAFKRAFGVGKKNYAKVFAINGFIIGIFFIIDYLFYMLMGNLPNSLNFDMLMFKDFSYIISMTPLKLFALFVFISVKSALFVVASSVKTGLSTSIMGEETSEKDAYDKVRSSL